MRTRRATAGLLVMLYLLPGCEGGFSSRVGLAPPDIDANATFAAYRTSDGFTIARYEGKTGSIDAATWSGITPTFHVLIEGQPVGELQVPDVAQVVVTHSSASASGHGSVMPTWDDGAIRLTIRSSSGETLKTRSLRRVGTTSGMNVLSHAMQSELDMRGTYRSDLRDRDDRIVGWLQVKLWEPTTRPVYEAVFPQGFPAADASAAAVSLDSEVAWMRRTIPSLTRGRTGG